MKPLFFKPPKGQIKREYSNQVYTYGADLICKDCSQPWHDKYDEQGDSQWEEGRCDWCGKEKQVVQRDFFGQINEPKDKAELEFF